MNEKNLLNDIYGEAGHSTNLKLSISDLEILRKMIRIQWLYRLQLLIPEEVHHFDRLGMEQYHLGCHLINHATAWPKNSRVFPREAVAIIRKMDFFQVLQEELGNFKIADEENLGWENIYWRLVRPGNTDYGSIHADKWFWDLGEYGDKREFPFERLKLWAPIYSVSGKNGLFVVPGSHIKKDWKWHIEELYGRKKPVIDEPKENLNLYLLPLSPGQSVVFHDELLHGGAPNLADTTRVSLEFTILVPRKD